MGSGSMFSKVRGGEIYRDHFSPGLYVCAKCGHQLFSSESKFGHASPWPAFTQTVPELRHQERRLSRSLESELWELFPRSGTRVPGRRSRGSVKILNLQSHPQI